MALRALLLLSLGLNLLAGFYVWRAWNGPEAELATPHLSADAETTLPKTNVVVRRHLISWEEIESDNYEVYIANLRAIGCPEPTIRDIITGEIDQWFARRKAEEMREMSFPEQEWWRDDFEVTVARHLSERMSELEMERREILSELLGPDWDETEVFEWADTVLISWDGQVLGALSPAKREAVHAIEAEALRRRHDYYQELGGAEPDPAVLAQIERERRSELARTLDALQLEEYLLRHGESARQLRQEFAGVDLTPEEFRSIFRIRDPIDQQIENYFSGEDSGSIRLAARLEIERDKAVEQILGLDRARLSQWLQDPLFRETRDSVEQLGIGAESVLSIYEIQRMTELETLRIRQDSVMSEEERQAAIEAAWALRDETLRRLLGPEKFEEYRLMNDINP